ncbi:MAG: DUF3781 domain-containing protein [Bacteroidales bacterium]|jgi:hypothetical protein|nr:DUF3781 domain-containing protein [Bacteroidales bacterium]
MFERQAELKREVIANLDKLHTTEAGKERIKKNLCLETDDVVDWCAEKIQDPGNYICRRGKNWHINIHNYEITVNACSYTIITAHKNF